MIVLFEKDYLRELYEEGKSTDKKHRMPGPVVKKYCLRVETLRNAPFIEALFPLNSLNFEALSGDKAGMYSIRIDLRYRLEFTLQKEDDSTLTICNLQDITNHYE